MCAPADSDFGRGGAERPSVAIVAVNYEQTALTCEMLASVERAGLHRWCEVWVVDNASALDGSYELRAAYPWVRTVRSPRNLGFAGGNNLALRRTDADYVFLLNNDALVDPGVLEGMLFRFRENPRLGALSPVVYDYPQRGREATVQYAGATRVSPLTGRNATSYARASAPEVPGGLAPTAYAHGAAMLVSRAALEAAGLLSEAFFLYYEELDWCDRIRAAGYEVAVDRDRAVWHRESATTGGDSAFKTYWINRSRLLYMRRRGGLGALAFPLFFLACVLPLHGLRHLLAGRHAHLRALWAAYADQPRDAASDELAFDPDGEFAPRRASARPADEPVAA